MPVLLGHLGSPTQPLIPLGLLLPTRVELHLPAGLSQLLCLVPFSRLALRLALLLALLLVLRVAFSAVPQPALRELALLRVLLRLRRRLSRASPSSTGS